MALMAEDEQDGSQELLAVEQQAVAMQEALGKLGAFSPEELAHYGHECLLRLLVAKVSSATASHQEMAILRNLLRDNGMVMGMAPYKTIENVPAEGQPALPQLDEYKP